MNHNAGCKTAVSNIIMAVTIMVTLLFLMPLFQYTPNVVLGAIIITAVVGLIDVPAAYQIWKIDKFDFVVMLCAFLGALFISVQNGLAIAVSSLFFNIFSVQFYLRVPGKLSQNLTYVWNPLHLSTTPFHTLFETI